MELTSHIGEQTETNDQKHKPVVKAQKHNNAKVETDSKYQALYQETYLIYSCASEEQAIWLSYIVNQIQL